MHTKDHNNYYSKIYKVEYSRISIEILDNEHIHYFGSSRLKDGFFYNIKEHIIKINSKKFLKIQNYWELNY